MDVSGSNQEHSDFLPLNVNWGWTTSHLVQQVSVVKTSGMNSQAPCRAYKPGPGKSFVIKARTE